LAIVVAAAPVSAFAQNGPPTAQELETARTLYKEGKELRAAGDLKGALEKLQAANALGHTPVTAIELARTYVMVHRLVEAREVALSIARLGVASDETEKSAEARAEGAKLADDLRPRIPALTVKISGLSPGEIAHLTIDGGVVPDAAVTEAQKVDPGPHQLVVRVGEGAAAREVHASADVAEGQAVDVPVEVPPAPASAPPPPKDHGLEVREAPRSMPVLAKVGFGFAIAGAAVGLYTGVTALNKKSQLDNECNAQKQCGENDNGASDLYAARTWANASTVSFIIGVAGLGTGIVALLLDRPSSPAASGVRIEPLLGLGVAGVHGDF